MKQTFHNISTQQHFTITVAMKTIYKLTLPKPDFAQTPIQTLISIWLSIHLSVLPTDSLNLLYDTVLASVAKTSIQISHQLLCLDYHCSPANVSSFPHFRLVL
jgi:hypothetical protein